eukprot:6189986-Pleurochrysis_carterae.AAC.1
MCARACASHGIRPPARVRALVCARARPAATRAFRSLARVCAHVGDLARASACATREPRGSVYAELRVRARACACASVSMGERATVRESACARLHVYVCSSARVRVLRCDAGVFRKDRLRGLAIEDSLAAATAGAAELRRRGAHAVVALTHQSLKAGARGAAERQRARCDAVDVLVEACGVGTPFCDGWWRGPNASYL